MADPTGHESGHSLEGAARGWTWADVVDALIAERGSLAELARHLMDVAPASAKLSDDPMTVERGLRRLRARRSREGNRYGRLVLRCLGAPSAMSQQLRALGQYHSRASDLSVDARHARLLRWDRPPVTESREAIWLHLAVATAANQRGDHEAVAQRVALVRTLVRHAEPMARAEAHLLLARLAMDAGDARRAIEHLDAADVVVVDGKMPPDERACYHARAVDQRVFVDRRVDPAYPLGAAIAAYDEIPDGVDAPPFAAFRRAHGRAWCLWKLDRRDDALASARRAAMHAGDGGYVRFRVMALVLHAHILDRGAEQTALAARARAMARGLGDVALEASAARLMGERTGG